VSHRLEAIAAAWRTWIMNEQPLIAATNYRIATQVYFILRNICFAQPKSFDDAHNV